MGENAADLLLKRIEKPNRKFETIVLPPELHVWAVDPYAAAACCTSALSDSL